MRDRKPDITPGSRASTAATEPPVWLSKDAKGGRSMVSRAVDTSTRDEFDARVD